MKDTAVNETKVIPRQRAGLDVLFWQMMVVLTEDGRSAATGGAVNVVLKERGGA